jgi:hypothetical protein
LTLTTCHCAGNVSYRQRSSDDRRGRDARLGVGMLGIGINK